MDRPCSETLRTFGIPEACSGLTCCCPFFVTISEETCQPQAWDVDLWEAGGPCWPCPASLASYTSCQFPCLVCSWHPAPFQFLECAFLHAVPTAWDPFCPLPAFDAFDSSLTFRVWRKPHLLRGPLLETLSSRAPWLTTASSVSPNPTPLFTPFFPSGHQSW